MSRILASGRADLTDAQWRVLERALRPLLQVTAGMGRPLKWTRRQLIDGIRWRVRVGAPWRDVPVQYGSWQRVYGTFRSWQRIGTWARLLFTLRGWAQVKGQIVWSVSVDSTVNRAHQHTAGARRNPQAQRNHPGCSRRNRTIMPWDVHAVGGPRGPPWTSCRAASTVPKELADVVRAVGDEAARSAFSSMLGGRRTRRIVLGKYVDWFGHRDRGMKHDPIDRLVDLNSWAADPESGNHQQAIDELVWDAFLTDLREHFHDKDADSWRFSCVLLMDNVDSRIGQEFVTGLVRNRSTRREDPDPLAAVVTSTGELLAFRDPQEIAEDGVPDAGWRRFRRHRLSDLAEDDTINMIANTGLRTGHTPGLPIMIHQLIGGHPATTQLMITTVAEHESIRDQPLRLLTQLEPGTGPDRKCVAERIRANLLGEFPNDLLDELITCAAATDVEHLRWLADLSPDSERLLYQIEQLLWPSVGGAGPQVLRRMLLPLLGEREDEHPASWEKVFERLRAGRDAAGDQPGELYYALAVGDLTHVVSELEQRLSRLGCEEWSQLLLAVTAAPRRLADPVPGQPPLSPDEQCRALLRGPGRSWPSVELARLVVGLWIVNDPMTDARRRSLHEQIADDYEWLAGFSPQDSVQSYRQSGHRHRRLGDLWPWN